MTNERAVRLKFQVWERALSGSIDFYFYRYESDKCRSEVIDLRYQPCRQAVAFPPRKVTQFRFYGDFSRQGACWRNLPLFHIPRLPRRDADVRKKSDARDNRRLSRFPRCVLLGVVSVPSTVSRNDTSECHSAGSQSDVIKRRTGLTRGAFYKETSPRLTWQCELILRG